MEFFSQDWPGLNKRIKESELSQFRKNYLLTLATHGREFEICGHLKAAKAQFEKIEKQLEEKSRKLKAKVPEGEFDFNKVEENYFRHSLDDIMHVLKEDGVEIPKGEKQLLREQVQKLESQNLIPQPKTTHVAHKKFSTIQRDRLHSLRLTLLNKVTRYKVFSKRPHDKTFVETAGFPDVVGTYNTRYNICEALDMLQKSDAILVEDLKEHYSQVASLSSLF